MSIAATDFPQCAGTVKCCDSVKAYSDLEPTLRDTYGLDPETDNANICDNATTVTNDSDLEVCDIPQCCGPFVPTHPLPDNVAFNCHDL